LLFQSKLGLHLTRMGDNEQKANALVAEAEKKLSGGKGFLAGFFGGASKQDEALECYARAANLYKMAKKWSAAGNTFCTVANHHVKFGNKHDAATNFVDAANCYKKNDPREAATSLQKAIDIYTDMGRFTIAAKHHETIAGIFESEVADLDKAMQHYEQAADYFKGEESNSSANKCMLKVAQYAAQLENYTKAIQIYEQVAASALESNLLKYSAKEHFFRASLCHLCIDALNAQHAVSKYEEQYPAFGDSREAKLIKSLVETLEQQDVEAFTTAVKEYDSVNRLDPWFTTLLLRVKKLIPVEDDLC
jgi:alpha-soluble NSF attachment protein